MQMEQELQTWWSSAEEQDLQLRWKKVQQLYQRKYHRILSKNNARQILHLISPQEYDFFTKKSIRSESGILNVSVVMPPDRFSCRYNCKFCPNQTKANGADIDMPRSYLSNEDAVKRAAAVNFDPIQQVWTRLYALRQNGHPIDKIEIRILGGTFSCYPKQVATHFIHQIYHAVNTFDSQKCEPHDSLEDSQNWHAQYSQYHIVGIGIETRPDEITETECIRFRQYGITRVELGVQHVDDQLLRRVQRGHTIQHSRRAIRLLKNFGFKIEMHIMTDLPGATPEGDMFCYRQILQDDSSLFPDYLKDYPCLDVIYTEIREWKKNGKWKPYSEWTPDAHHLKEVLIYRQSITPCWVRVNRVQRDFSQVDSPIELGYQSSSIPSNLRQYVTLEAEKRGIFCQCIRCREIRCQTLQGPIQYMTHRFMASSDDEFFISAEVLKTPRNQLLGFIRLRLMNQSSCPMLPDLAMIRELHVYGRISRVSLSDNQHVQHQGIGKRLLRKAETIAFWNGKKGMAIISGVGVRPYYEKRGYTLYNTYMIKYWPWYWQIVLVLLQTIIFSFQTIIWLPIRSNICKI